MTNHPTAKKAKRAEKDYGGYVGAALKRLDGEAREKRKRDRASGKKETTGEKIAANRLWADNLYVTERAALAKQIDRAIRRAVRRIAKEAPEHAPPFGNTQAARDWRDGIETRYGVKL